MKPSIVRKVSIENLILQPGPGRRVCNGVATQAPKDQALALLPNLARTVFGAVIR